MNRFHNLASHQHLLFLGEGHVHFLVGCHEATKIEIPHVSVGGSTPTTQHIVGMWVPNVGCLLLVGFLG